MHSHSTHATTLDTDEEGAESHNRLAITTTLVLLLAHILRSVSVENCLCVAELPCFLGSTAQGPLRPVVLLVLSFKIPLRAKNALPMTIIFSLSIPIVLTFPSLLDCSLPDRFFFSSQVGVTLLAGASLFYSPVVKSCRCLRRLSEEEPDDAVTNALGYRVGTTGATQDLGLVQ
jgi:hypothetical protein